MLQANSYKPIVAALPHGRGAFRPAVKSLCEDWDGADGSENVGMSNY